jgi:hypothetical protein
MLTATAVALLTALMTLTWAAAPAARAAGQSSAVDASTRATLMAERQRVRAELDRVNLEIDALKRDDRGMRDDYRLRARLADAEALARRLTEIDARLGTTPGGSASRVPALAAEPTVAPTDGPAEMEAKADILADQARRIGAEAQAVRQRAQQLKARQDLRRRVGQMEQDPFSPLEGSKRRLPTTGSSAATSFQGGRSADTPGPTTSQPAVPPTGGIADSTATPGRGGSAPQIGGGVLTPSPTPATPVSSGGASSGGSSALTPQVRDLLDPATLGEVRRLESSGAPGANVEALERVAAALRARAERLQAQSQAMRARARAAH